MEYTEWLYIKKGDRIKLSKNDDAASFEVLSDPKTVVNLKSESTGKLVKIWKYNYPGVYKLTSIN